jgi:hypothetical protein
MAAVLFAIAKSADQKGRNRVKDEMIVPCLLT